MQLAPSSNTKQTHTNQNTHLMVCPTTVNPWYAAKHVAKKYTITKMIRHLQTNSWQRGKETSYNTVVQLYQRPADVNRMGVMRANTLLLNLKQTPPYT